MRNFFRAFMSDYIIIPVGDIIKVGQTTEKYCDKKYIVYINSKSRGQKIRVNTDYRIMGDRVKLCRSYDRGLCDTMEEYNRLDLDYVEGQAYNSWMDGARG